ncbi:CNP1-like family protein [Nitrosomonas communis]|uniref:CNP1-like family protein n=1 Tax=Nitrosomonas communis TaxID=44574 RepID=UPI0026F163F2|nr:CNP1-like family protein [Nitrosomonas communis]MCO6427226.1 CNP1-like family protein [Nitrosomonas communis]
MKNVLLTFCILAITACVSKEKFVDTFDHKKDWIELQTELPAYPEAGNLLEFNIGPTSNHRYYVDATSIKVGKDGIIRYSLVVKSAQGAENATFEGIRCETKEKKRYALGRNDKTWGQPRISKWQKLENIAQDQAQRELAKYYFCPRGFLVATPAEAIHALKAGIHPKALR